MTEILNTDYNDYIDLIGTAHFTKRSINEVYESVQSIKPRNIALELDWIRFKSLNTTCLVCPRSRLCKGICEFIGASNALGNSDANIWLIDMSEKQMKERVRRAMTFSRRFDKNRYPIYRRMSEDPIRLWENGFKERVIENSKKEIEIGRMRFPSLWRVLIDERNTLMAARLAWIATTNIDELRNSRMLVFVGAAHVEGIGDLLGDPSKIKDGIKVFNLSFTEPTLIRRVAIQDN